MGTCDEVCLFGHAGVWPKVGSDDLETFSKLNDPVILWRRLSQNWCHPCWSRPLEHPALLGMSHSGQHSAQDPLAHTVRGKKAASSCQDQLAQELQ